MERRRDRGREPGFLDWESADPTGCPSGSVRLPAQLRSTVSRKAGRHDPGRSFGDEMLGDVRPQPAPCRHDRALLRRDGSPHTARRAALLSLPGPSGRQGGVRLPREALGQAVLQPSPLAIVRRDAPGCNGSSPTAAPELPMNPTAHGGTTSGRDGFRRMLTAITSELRREHTVRVLAFALRPGRPSTDESCASRSRRTPSRPRPCVRHGPFAQRRPLRADRLAAPMAEPLPRELTSSARTSSM